jgi:catechol 2,3-dioxygenase-like lactoylglutathione lyase family enzyme
MKIAHLLPSALLVLAATQAQPAPPRAPSDLGNFSVSLTVRDIAASKAFYEKLGFTQGHGDVSQRWVIMKNGDVKIGLFQGMFDRNALTFNPGWDANGQNVERFEDVRAIQRRLKAAGLAVGTDITSPSGPAHFALTDPDGNPILIDQHR